MPFGKYVRALTQTVRKAYKKIPPESGTFAAGFVKVRIKPYYDRLVATGAGEQLRQLSPKKKIAVEAGLNAISTAVSSQIGDGDPIREFARSIIEDAGPEITQRIRKNFDHPTDNPTGSSQESREETKDTPSTKPASKGANRS